MTTAAKRTAAWLVLSVVVTILAVPGSWLVAKLYQYRQHRKACERIEDVLVSLADKCPANVSFEHWDSALGWTWNAKANCLALPEYLMDGTGSEEQFARFADELEQHARGPVGAATIEWIWDEIERLSKNGKRYSDNYRPVRSGRFNEPNCEFFAGTRFVSIANSRMFHKRDCPFVRELPWREVTAYYSSRDSGISSGMVPCTECNP